MTSILLFSNLSCAQTPTDAAGIDWAKAQELHQRAQRGESLSPEEQAYYERAKQMRGSRGADAARGDRKAGSRAEWQPPQKLPEVPLTELGTATYQGETGGLYGHGRNAPPPEHLQAALAAAGQIVPRDAAGKPESDGRIVLLSLGMSNTTQEYSRFKAIADEATDLSPRVMVVDGAQGGQDARRIADAGAPFWVEVNKRLEQSGVTPQQVQAVWLKEAMIQPTAPFPAEAHQLEVLLGRIVRIAKEQFPNLGIIYLSSRTYGGYAATPLNPEPHAFESAFAVRWLIEKQISGDWELNWNPEKGPVVAPVLLWGPYLWAAGETPRQADGLVWRREDCGGDGTHPSPSGRDKVAHLLLEFFRHDETTQGWFLPTP